MLEKHKHCQTHCCFKCKYCKYGCSDCPVMLGEIIQDCKCETCNVLLLNLYVVKNSEDKYFRAKGRSGYGESWVEDITRAKIYTKLSQAKARVTYFANNFKNLTVPEILELNVSFGNIIKR